MRSSFGVSHDFDVQDLFNGHYTHLFRSGEHALAMGFRFQMEWAATSCVGSGYTLGWLLRRLACFAFW